MTTTQWPRPGLAYQATLLVCVVFFTAALAVNHLKLVSHEYPLDYNEGGMLVTTASLVKGESPYSIASQPAHISLYPIMTNILVAPLARVFGNTFELHRIVCAIFILACCALCYYLCRRASGGRTESFIAAALCYAALLHYSTPVASTNSLGLFLFLSAITVPWVNGFSTRSLAVAILLGILAFYTKQYFVACLGYVALYMFLTESKRRAIYFGLASLAAFSAVLVVVYYTVPFYLEATLFAVGSAYIVYAYNEYVVGQLGEYMQIYLPLLIMLTCAAVYRWYLKRRSPAPEGPGSQRGRPVNLRHFDQPLLAYKPNYIWFCCACSIFIFVLILGRNPGNHLTYLFQVVSPFLLVGTFALVSGLPKARWPFSVLIVWSLYNCYVMLPRDFSVNDEGWRRIRSEISRADDIYASTLVVEEAVARGSPLYLSGGTRYFIFAGAKPSFFVKADEQHREPQIWERHVERIQSKIVNREFDLLVIDNLMSLPKSFQDSGVDTQALLEAHYKLVAEIKLPLMKRLGGGGYRVKIWKPRRAPAALSD